MLSGLVRHAHAAMGDWDEEYMGRCGVWLLCFCVSLCVRVRVRVCGGGGVE